MKSIIFVLPTVIFISSSVNTILVSVSSLWKIVPPTYKSLPISCDSATFIFLNEPDAEPLRFDVISCVPVILNIEPSNVKFADESTPCVPVNVVIWLFTPLPLMIESPFDNNIFFSKSFAPAIQ